jgi:hypothetical protein
VIISTMKTTSDDTGRNGRVGNSFSTVNQSAAASLAKRAEEPHAAPRITDDVLRRALQAILDRSAQGDVQAAARAFSSSRWPEALAVRSMVGFNQRVWNSFWRRASLCSHGAF